MILLLDAGNSRLKWGLWQAGTWRGRGALGLDEIDSLAVALEGESVTWVGACCVAGEPVRQHLEDWFARLAVPVHWLRAPARGHGVINRYASPDSLGADRFAALVGAWRNALAPCVVAAAGTAITVDALGPDGEFSGGLILPGRRLMHESLRSGTAGVRVVAGAGVDFPRATADAVAAGVLAAAAGAVMTMRGRLERRVAAPVRLVLTGGDAAWLEPALDGDVFRFDDLVLEGLRWVAHDLNAPER